MKVEDKVKSVNNGRLAVVIETKETLIIEVKVRFDDGSEEWYNKTSFRIFVPPALILEPGKEYVSESGKRYRCISNMRLEQKEFPIIMECYRADLRQWRGPYYYTVDGRNKWDSGERIIGPWPTHPLVDWSLYSKWTKAVAKLGTGREWCECAAMPKKEYNYYHAHVGTYLLIPPEYAPKNPDGTPWEGAWEDSLVLRPEE